MVPPNNNPSCIRMHVLALCPLLFVMVAVAGPFQRAMAQQLPRKIENLSLDADRASIEQMLERTAKPAPSGAAGLRRLEVRAATSAVKLPEVTVLFLEDQPYAIEVVYPASEQTADRVRLLVDLLVQLNFHYVSELEGDRRVHRFTDQTTIWVINANPSRSAADTSRVMLLDNKRLREASRRRAAARGTPVPAPGQGAEQ